MKDWGLFRGGLTLGRPGERGSALARWRGRANGFDQNRLGSSILVEGGGEKYRLSLSTSINVKNKRKDSEIR